MSMADGARLTGDGDPAEPKALLDAPHVGDGVGGGEHDRVRDEAVLEPAPSATRAPALDVLLDRADHCSLHLRRHVVVDHAEAAQELQRRYQRRVPAGACWHQRSPAARALHIPPKLFLLAERERERDVRPWRLPSRSR